jgi:hypothetical protein
MIRSDAMHVAGSGVEAQGSHSGSRCGGHSECDGHSECRPSRIANLAEKVLSGRSLPADCRFHFAEHNGPPCSGAPWLRITNVSMDAVGMYAPAWSRAGASRGGLSSPGYGFLAETDLTIRWSQAIRSWDWR